MKVFIFANCHGLFYKQAISTHLLPGTYEVEHVISYENLNNYEKLIDKFSSCDILVIQPIANYEMFKIDNIKKLLKKNCFIIKTPFVRFEGFWSESDSRPTKNISRAAVDRFPRILKTADVNKYLTGEDCDHHTILSQFNQCLDILRALENEGDIKFVDFFLENYQKIPLFRDSYHPTRYLSQHIANQVIEKITEYFPEKDAGLKRSVDTSIKREFGHFKPIRDSVAKALGLGFDLDSYFLYSRQDFLEGVLWLEENYQNQIASLDEFQNSMTIYLQKKAFIASQKGEKLNTNINSNHVPAGAKGIHLFMPYFKVADKRRQQEFINCLKINSSNQEIDRIYLLVDDGHTPELASEKIEVIHMSKRPTYQDWHTLTVEKCTSGISVLANTDIYFDESIKKLSMLFRSGNEFLALSRFEKIGPDLFLHKNPHWSQDVWAMSANSILPSNLVKSLDFPMGVPRCDNKIAYLFSINGFRVFNPCSDVKSVHLHESQVRGYDKKLDRTIMGGVAYVQPCPDLVTPSKIEMQVWGLDFSHVTKIGLNKSLEIWNKEAESEAIPDTASYIPVIECILIPLVRRELSDLISYFETALRPTKLVKKLALVVSIDKIWDPADIENVRIHFLKSPIAESIERLEFVSCGLSEEESIYIRDIPKDIDSRKIPEYGLKSGPNKQFFVSIKKIEEIGIKASAVMLQEVDTIPLREYWIDEINVHLKKIKNALLVGAKCSSSTPLSVELVNHVNGNAVLCISNPDFQRFFQCWERVVVEVIKKAPWKAYDSATEWVIHHRTNNIKNPYDGQQIKDTAFFNSKEFDYYVELYNRNVHRANFLLNLADVTRSAPNYIFHPNEFVNNLNEAAVLHLRAALPHRDGIRLLASSATTGVIIYDADWQYPAITEKHAACQARKFFSPSPDVIYFGFPWATLIDQLLHMKEDSSRLITVLNSYKPLLSAFAKVVTVCQHIHMLKFQNIFREVGITDVFWTHAIKDQTSLPEYPSVKIKPFPLFPVQYYPGCEVDRTDKHLYSFVGARSPAYYLTDSRNKIIDLLSNETSGIVVGRNGWHYNKIVYGHQIKKTVGEDQALIDVSATEEFKIILKNSIFSLCPSGSGPNSIRLWESIGYGSIPVILADTYLPPGDLELWKEAAVFCEENEESIRALPARLKKLASEPGLLGRKRQAMRQLWMMYGPDCFVYDIQKQFNSPNETPNSGQMNLKDASIGAMVTAVLNSKGTESESMRILLLSCSSRMLSAPADFTDRYRQDGRLREACQLAMQQASPETVRHVEMVSAIKNVTLIS